MTEEEKQALIAEAEQIAALGDQASPEQIARLDEITKALEEDNAKAAEVVAELQKAGSIEKFARAKEAMVSLKTETEKFASRPAPRKTEAPAVHTKKWKYDLKRAFQGIAKERTLDGMEGEWSQERRKQFSGIRSVVGELVPTRAFANYGKVEFDWVTGDTPTLLEPQHDGRYGDVQRDYDPLRDMGVTIHTGKTHAFSSGVYTADPELHFPGENQTAPATKPEYRKYDFKPHTGQARVAVSHDALYSNENVDEQLRRALDPSVRVGAAKIAISGDGVTEPYGLLTDPDNASRIITSITSVSRANLKKMQYAVRKGNFITNKFSWLGNYDVSSKLDSTPEESGFPKYILGDDGKVYGDPFYGTNIVPNMGSPATGVLVYGAFEFLEVAFFGPADAVELIVDRNTLSSKGMVQYTALVSLDVNTARPEAFSVASKIAI